MMPAPGDQHRTSTDTSVNPYEPAENRISAYTAQEIATLQAKLDKQLGPEYISNRPGASGQKVHYLAAEKVIGLANEIFGFNGWSSSIQNIQIDFVDENASTGRVSLGLSVIVRVTLKDGTYHEDVGYGTIDNCKGKAAAFEKCKKEGTTDALKRALRTFGNVLGNCIYDKEFLSKVTKVKVGAGRFDVNDLHRHHDFKPRKEEIKQEVVVRLDIGNDSASTTLDVDAGFDFADFDDADLAEGDFDHPDEVVLPADMTRANQLMGPPAKGGITTPSRPLNTRTAQVPAAAHRALHNADTDPIATTTPRVPVPSVPQQQGRLPRAAVHPDNDQQVDTDDEDFALLYPDKPMPPVTFFSARAATNVDPENKGVAAVPLFNPRAESPSIRKTAGVDHSKTVPVRHIARPREMAKDFVDPKADPSRRLGGPCQPGQSPTVKTTSAYRPPTRKPPESANSNAVGGVDEVLQAARRPPLSDVSNVSGQHNATAKTADGADAKRQRIAGPDSMEGGVENSNPVGAG